MNIKFKSIQLLFEPRDLWIGVYWNVEQKYQENELSIYFCLIPCLPIRIKATSDRGDLCNLIGHRFEDYAYQRQEGYKRCRACGHMEYFNKGAIAEDE